MVAVVAGCRKAFVGTWYRLALGRLALGRLALGRLAISLHLGKNWLRNTPLTFRGSISGTVSLMPTSS